MASYQDDDWIAADGGGLILEARAAADDANVGHFELGGWPDEGKDE